MLDNTHIYENENYYRTQEPYLLDLVNAGSIPVRTLSYFDLFPKRSLDIVGSIVGLFLFGLFAALLYIPYRFGGNKGPLLYKQTRYGKNGKIFQIYKFRTMIVGAEEVLKNDPKLWAEYQRNGNKLENDPRVTKLGHLLRVLSIDELPQFINVFKGEMSLVGPRPILEIELKEYGEKLEYLLMAKPGLTGYWTTHGRSKILFPDRADMELKYLEMRGTGYDLWLIARTVVQIFVADDSY